jgi:hypothetical protein
MARAFQRSYLGEAPSRLQNALDLDGEVKLELETAITPTVLLADCTLPGYSQKAGRRFMASTVTGPISRFLLKALPLSDGLIVEGMMVSVRVITSRLWARVVDPTTALALVPSITPNLFSSDRRVTLVGGELPGVLGETGVGGTAAPASLQLSMTMIPNLAPVYVPLNVFLMPGGAFDVALVAATAELDITLFGRVWPT